MNDDEFISKVAALADKWNTAEEWVKRGENINRTPIVPAINELRYAGRRIVDAFAAHKNGDGQKAEKFIADADLDLDKARHDVVDTLYSFYSDNARELLDEIGRASAHEHFPRYAKLFALIKTMGKKIELARSDRDQRETIYSRLIEKLPELEELYNEFAVSVDAIAEKIKADTERMKATLAESTGKAKLAIKVAVIGWLLTAALIAANFWQ